MAMIGRSGDRGGGWGVAVILCGSGGGECVCVIQCSGGRCGRGGVTVILCTGCGGQGVGVGMIGRGNGMLGRGGESVEGRGGVGRVGCGRWMAGERCGGGYDIRWVWGLGQWVVLRSGGMGVWGRGAGHLGRF